jgi:GAF domain-containing protein
MAILLFRAEAASLALASSDGSLLEFAVASGAKGAGVVGRSIGIGEGIAGYVLQTGQPMTIASPEDDPRFGRTIAAQTGYVPTSIMAVPLLTQDRAIGVIEVLDCRDGAFTPRDLELASAFARQAAIAVDAFRIEREFPVLVARTLASYGIEDDPSLAAELGSLAASDDDEFWALVEDIAGLASVNPRMRRFVRELLPVIHRNLEESKGPRFGR